MAWTVEDSLTQTWSNKTLIAIIIFLIISLALIICVIISSSLLQYGSNTSPALKEFCAASESYVRCIASLSSSIKTTRHTDPTRVFTLSLEAALRKLFHLNSIVSRSNSGLENCWSSLQAAMRGLDVALSGMRVIETLELRRSMLMLIESAAQALGSCGKDLEKKAGAMVQEVEVLLRSSRDFVGHLGWVNRNGGYWSTRTILEYACRHVWVAVLGLDFVVLLVFVLKFDYFTL